eukprot:scaffold5017_cov171-Amphora_coffeaeformis.AAC.22
MVPNIECQEVKQCSVYEIDQEVHSSGSNHWKMPVENATTVSCFFSKSAFTKKNYKKDDSERICRECEAVERKNNQKTAANETAAASSSAESTAIVGGKRPASVVTPPTDPANKKPKIGENTDMKTCVLCQVTKSRDEFSKTQWKKKHKCEECLGRYEFDLCRQRISRMFG